MSGIAVRADHQRCCRKWFKTRRIYGDSLRIGRIIGDFNVMTDELRFRFILLSLESDTGAFIHLPGFVMKKCFTNDSGIQKYQRPCITVEFLSGRNSCFRYGYAEALIVFPNPFMSPVMVVLFQVNVPVTI